MAHNPKQLTSKRYLLKFSYIGTNYQGISSDLTLKLRKKSITQVLEAALDKFNKR